MARWMRIGLLLSVAAALVVISGCMGLWVRSHNPEILPMGIDPPEWVELAENPVFGQGVSGPKAYYPCVLHDEARFSGNGASAAYKMWYGTSSNQTGLAISEDGISWTDLGVVLPAGYHATVTYDPAGFPGIGPDTGTMHYRVWYWDPRFLYSIQALAYGESPDGEIWTNLQPCANGAVPIVSGGDPWWNRGTYGPCDVLIDPGASNAGDDWMFTMYYDGTTGGTEAIGLGYSADGVTWTGHDENGDGKADPVLTGTYVAGSWDFDYVSRAAVLAVTGGYEMWYSGGSGTMNHGIGHATSADGIHWVRDAENPVLHRDDGPEWRSSRTYCPSVLRLDDGLAMWFAGRSASSGDYAIGLATLPPATIPVELDVKPDSDENVINLNARGVLPAAVLGTAEFDIAQIDPSTVRLSNAAPTRWHDEEINGDGIVDLLFQFPISELELDPDEAEAVLTGATWSGVAIRGSDTVKLVSNGKKP